jgi:hypothetical protein
MNRFALYGIPAALGAVIGGARGAQEDGLTGAIGGAAAGAGLGALGMGLGRAFAPTSGPLAGKFAADLIKAQNVGSQGLSKLAGKTKGFAPNLSTGMEKLASQMYAGQPSSSQMLKNQMLVNQLGTAALGAGGAAGGIELASNLIPMVNQDIIMDPETPGSSNTMGARLSTPTLRYLG